MTNTERVLVADVLRLEEYIDQWVEAWGPYQTICVDNPWWHADQKKVRKDGKTPTKGIGACHHYDLIKTPDLCKLGPTIAKLAADRCHMYVWATCPLLPDAFQFLQACGFKYSTVAFAWIKLNPKMARDWPDPKRRAKIEAGLGLIDLLLKLTFYGPGYFTASNIEVVLLGWKKKPFRHPKDHKVRQLLFWPRLSHSEKPDVVQERIEWTHPDATPRLELFARRPRPGWTCFGAEADGQERKVAEIKEAQFYVDGIRFQAPDILCQVPLFPL